MYDPVLARFVSADSVVPGSAAGSMDGVQLKPLTVDFHEPGFAGRLNSESAQPFWFQLSDDAKQQVGEPWGPQEAQALNRYSYVRNASVRYRDPTGHWVINIGFTIRAGAYLGGSYNIGVTFDGKGNVALYETTNKGATIGATMGVGGGAAVGPSHHKLPSNAVI